MESSEILWHALYPNYPGKWIRTQVGKRDALTEACEKCFKSQDQAEITQGRGGTECELGEATPKDVVFVECVTGPVSC